VSNTAPDEPATSGFNAFDLSPKLRGSSGEREALFYAGIEI